MDFDNLIKQCIERHNNPLKQIQSDRIPYHNDKDYPTHYKVWVAKDLCLDLKKLTDAGISYNPIYHATEDNDAFCPEKFVTNPVQTGKQGWDTPYEMRDWYPASWRNSWGLQIFTGKHSGWWTDLDFEYKIIEHHPQLLIVCLKTLCQLTDNPLLIISKSGGLRYCCRTPEYAHPRKDDEKHYIAKWKMNDKGEAVQTELYLEIFGVMGQTRWDARYEIVSGDLLDPPIIDKDALFEPIDALRKILHVPKPKRAKSAITSRKYAKQKAFDHDDDNVILVNDPILLDTKTPKVLAPLARDTLLRMNAENNNPILYQRAKRLCRIQTDEEGRLSLKFLRDPDIRAWMEKSANWKRVVPTKGKDNEEFKTRLVDATLPLTVVEHFHQSDYTDFPTLLKIASHPLIKSDGSWHTQGYDPETECFVAKQGIEWNLDSLDTSDAGIQKAVDFLFNNLLVDFPFEDNSSRAHALCYILTPILMHVTKEDSLENHTPLFLFDAPTSRTGKGLLADVLSHIVFGTGKKSQPMPKTSEEFDKRILSELSAGSQLVFVDNVVTTARKPLVSDSLCVVLTAGYYSGRLLGTNEQIEVPNMSVWAMSGNNTHLHEDLANRTIPIRLVSDFEHPDDRDPEKFKHKLPEWGQQHRKELFEAVATIISAWHQAGCPKPTIAFSGFERWAAIMNGICKIVKVDGFLENRKQYRSRMIQKHGAWQDFTLAVVDLKGEARWEHREIDIFELASYIDDNEEDNSDTEDGNLLGDFIYGKNKASRVRELGKLLQNEVDRVYAGYRLVIDEIIGRRTYYRFEKIKKETPF